MTIPAVVHLGDIRFALSSLDLPIKGQDRLLARDDFVAVADGATPVAPGPRDVGEFAADALIALADHERSSLSQTLRCAIREVGCATADPAATPSAALALVRARAGRLELGVLGDCVVLVRLRDGATFAARMSVRDDASALLLERLFA